MGQKKIIVILSILIFIVIIAIIFLLKPNLSPSQDILDECKILSYNKGNNINIVFFSDKETAEKYSDFLIKIEPFDKNKDKLNFFYLDYKPECEIYKGIALLCYSSQLIKKAASCPNDFIVVVQEQGKKIRSSSYMNVLSLNSNQPLTAFPHELGHALAFLADEYVPSTLPKKSKNCVKNCDEFSGIKEGCFEGCSKSDYIRSVDSGIMRTLSSEKYGEFDEKLILEKISQETPGITGLAISTENTSECSEKEYYLIEGNYSGGKINITSRTLETGCVGKNGAGEFQYNIIMEDNSIAKEEEFNPELIFTDIQEEETKGDVLENSGIFLLKISIISGAKTLAILKDSKTITELNLYDVDSIPCKK